MRRWLLLTCLCVSFVCTGCNEPPEPEPTVAVGVRAVDWPQGSVKNALDYLYYRVEQLSGTNSLYILHIDD